MIHAPCEADGVLVEEAHDSGIVVASSHVDEAVAVGDAAQGAVPAEGGGGGGSVGLVTVGVIF